MTAEDVARFRREIVEYGALPAGSAGTARCRSSRRVGARQKVTVPTTYVWSDRDVALSRAGAELCGRLGRRALRARRARGRQPLDPDPGPGAVGRRDPGADSRRRHDRRAHPAPRGDRGEERGPPQPRAAAGARAAAAPGRRQPLPPRHRRRRRLVRRRGGDRRGAAPSASPGSCRSAATCPAPAGRSRPRRTYDALVAGVALHPNEAPRQADAGTLDEAHGGDRARSPRRTTRSGRSGRPGSTTSAPARTAGRRRSSPSAGTSTSPSGSTRPWSSTTATPTTRCSRCSTSEGAPERWVMHCFSGDAEFARRCLDRGAYLSFAGHRHLQERPAAARRARGHPPGPGAGRDRRAVPHADALPRPPQRVVPRPADDAGDGGGARATTSASCARRSTRTPRPRSAGAW